MTLATAPLQANTIYKCVDLDGFVTFSGTPCDEQLELTDEVIKERKWPAGSQRAGYGSNAPVPELGEARPPSEEQLPGAGGLDLQDAEDIVDQEP